MATEYSLKFDESMTEDEIEERSFRSLLPSEAHRRGTMEKKSHQQKESEEGEACLNETLIPETGSCSSLKVRRCSMLTLVLLWLLIENQCKYLLLCFINLNCVFRHILLKKIPELFLHGFYLSKPNSCPFYPWPSCSLMMHT